MCIYVGRYVGACCDRKWGFAAARQLAVKGGGVKICRHCYGLLCCGLREVWR